MTPADALAATQLPIRWMIADDGSGEEEHARLHELCKGFAAVFPGVELHCAERHAGKGGVVREAWSHLTPQQQDAANKKASEAIDYWRKKNAETLTRA